MNEELTSDDLQIWADLWTAVHDAHYNCAYEELCSSFLVSRWRKIDTFSKFLTTSTASGSALAAWTIWTSSAEGAGVWAGVSGVAALFAVVHTSLGISERIKDDTLIYSTFQQLRIDLENFKIKMQLRNYDSLTQYRAEYLDIVGKFGKSWAPKRPDFTLSEARRRLLQQQLNKTLGYENV
ncbi:MAG: hypothetical protein ING69_18115 [Rhodocyclaceae bacterium]|nr:hypothetical protein [Rhodocyclaceae bacterium]MCA3084560.1 hypothetical protein [Rhodocyclaceae bacterium]